MGGFASKDGKSTVTTGSAEVGSSKHHSGPNVPQSGGAQVGGSPSPRHLAAPKEAKRNSDHRHQHERERQQNVQESEAPGNNASSSSLRIKKGEDSGRWPGDVGGGGGMAGGASRSLIVTEEGACDEEEMQRAIEASLVEGHRQRSHHPSEGSRPPKSDRFGSAGRTSSPGLSGAAAAAGKGSRSVESGAAADTATSSQPNDVNGDRSGKAARLEGPTKAALGLNGTGWVDNSDFQSPQKHQRASSQNRPSNGQSTLRSASCGASSMRSGIVSLPQIKTPLPLDQQEMVKDLHEKIKDTTGQDDANGKTVNVRALMEGMDMALDEPLSRVNGKPSHGTASSRGTSSKTEHHFNEHFRSCRGANVDLT